MTLTLLVDNNISHLDDYFNSELMLNLNKKIEIIRVTGRDIDADMLNHYRPQALLVRSVTHVNESLLANNNSVQFVGSATIGTDHIDSDYLQRHNIAFSNAAGCSKHSVAQYVITAIAVLRPQYLIHSVLGSSTDMSQSQSHVNQDSNAHVQVQLPILGIIGLGNIGSTLAQYAKDLGWNILGYDPLLPKSAINNVSFKELIATADIISIHVPLTTKEQSDYPTHHLFNEKVFLHMKPDAILINSARGAVIKECALLADIQRNKRHVVLDVFEHEPIISKQLLSLITIVSPHIAGYTLEGKIRGTHIVYEAFCRYFNVPIRQSLGNLLPMNPYTWHKLQQDWTQLNSYYDIIADDKLLRQLPLYQDDKINELKRQLQIKGIDFDNLRKNYTLRREWVS